MYRWALCHRMSINETSGGKRKVRSAHGMAVTGTLKMITEMLSTLGEYNVNISQLKQRMLALSEKREILKKLGSELLEAVPTWRRIKTIIDAVEKKIELAILEFDDVRIMAACWGGCKLWPYLQHMRTCIHFLLLTQLLKTEWMSVRGKFLPPWNVDLQLHPLPWVYHSCSHWHRFYFSSS